MATYYYATGRPDATIAAGSSIYFNFGGLMGNGGSTDAPVQVVARGNSTFTRLAVEIRANASTAVSTIRTRKNGANGSMSVSIPSSTGAGATGEFEDATNSDSLAAASSDTFNLLAQVGAGGALTVAQVSALLQNANNLSLYASSSEAGVPVQPANTSTYLALVVPGLSAEVTESAAQYTFRQATTLSNLYVYLSQNGATTAGNVVRLRVNGANGNGVVSLTTATTGAFEDVTNTDVIAAGDEVNASTSNVNTGAGTSFTIVTLAAHSSAPGRIVASRGMNAITSGQTRFFPPGIGRQSSGLTTAAEMALPVRVSFTVSNVFANIAANPGGMTAIIQRNGTTTISLAVASGTSGFAEETATTATFSTGDTLGFGITVPTGAEVGTATPRFWGVLMQSVEAATARSRMLLGVGQ